LVDGQGRQIENIFWNYDRERREFADYPSDHFAVGAPARAGKRSESRMH